MSLWSVLSLPLLVAAQTSTTGPGTADGRAAGTFITVRGSSRLDLEKIEPVQGGVMLTIRLQDGELGDAIPERTVTAIIRREGVEVFRSSRKTTKAGSAQLFVPHQKGEHEISLSFTGDDLYAATTPASTRVDLSKEVVQLVLAAPPRVDLDAEMVRVSITARQQAPAPDLRITLRARRGNRIVLQRVGRTDAQGQLNLELPTKELGSAGEILLEAQSDATGQYNAARTSQRIFIVSDTTTTLVFPRTKGRRDATLSATGAVRDRSGPVSDGTVRLLAFGRTLVTVRTDSAGRFSARLALGQFPIGQVAVAAEFVPGTAWHRPSRALPVVLTVEPRRPIPVAYYLVPAFVTLLFVASVLLARRKPWRNLGARWRLRRILAQADRGGIALGRRRSIGGLFAADLYTVRGTVLDLHEGVALGGATVYLRSRIEGVRDLETRAEEDGTFALSEAPAGSRELLVTFPGYLPQSLDVSLPHRGELHGLLVRLESVRHRVMEVYTAVMAPRLPDPALVRYWTPAEAAAHVRARSQPPPAAVDALSELAAEVYYSPATPATEAAAEAESLAERARSTPGDGSMDGEPDP